MRLVSLMPYLQRFHEEHMSDPDYVADFLALELSHYIADIMAREGLTQRAMARRLGVSEAYVSRVLGGHPNLTLKSIAKMSLALGLRPSISFAGDSSPAASQATEPGDAGKSQPAPRGRTPRRLPRNRGGQSGRQQEITSTRQVKSYAPLRIPLL